jgi:hypothetical protein
MVRRYAMRPAIEIAGRMRQVRIESLSARRRR